MTDRDLQAIVSKNSVNEALLERLATMDVRDCHLTAGCLFQTVWNHLSGHAPTWGIKDYDIFYFDDRDLSWAAEDEMIRRVEHETAEMGVQVEVKNQARVHLWYRERFGGDYPQLRSARAGIDRYLICCTRVGIDVRTRSLYAPDGLDDLFAGKLRINPLSGERQLFEQKAESYRRRWPWLRIVE